MNAGRRPISRIAVTIAAAATTTLLVCWHPTAAGQATGRASAIAPRLSQAASAGVRTSALVRVAAPPPQGCDPTASLRPLGPPRVTPGSFMARIRARGYLIAGVDQNTYHFGYLNPLDDQIEGFDIDMLHAIAAAIFGDPDKIRFVSISDAQRISAVQSGRVDIVAHTMTITCARLQQVDFSTVYFDAGQRVLVLRNSTAQDLTDVLVDGGKVCATTGSTSLATIIAYAKLDAQVTDTPGSAVAVPYWTDCLVLLQEGDVAAISTDDSILAGLEAQDPETKIIGPRLTNEPYGLAISKEHPDFVRFVNAVLAEMRADGQWAASYKRWIGTPVPAPPPANYLR
jgi:polar amino acid transport system substrate-binding protein